MTNLHTIMTFFKLSDAVKVPVCLLVLEGGPGTLETVQQSILNNIPIIIVQVLHFTCVE